MRRFNRTWALFEEPSWEHAPDHPVRHIDDLENAQVRDESGHRVGLDLVNLERPGQRLDAVTDGLPGRFHEVGPDAGEDPISARLLEASAGPDLGRRQLPVAQDVDPERHLHPALDAGAADLAVSLDRVAVGG